MDLTRGKSIPDKRQAARVAAKVRVCLDWRGREDERMEPNTPDQNHPLRPWAQRDDPNPLEIRKMCEKFQAGWTEEERHKRQHGERGEDRWSPPQCSDE